MYINDFNNHEDSEDLNEETEAVSTNSHEPESTQENDRDKLDKLIRDRYPKIYKLDIEIEEIEVNFTYYFKKPNMTSFNRALKTASKKNYEAMRAFTLENIVDEQRTQFTEDLEDYPGLAMMAGNKLFAMLGVTDNVTLKKL